MELKEQQELMMDVTESFRNEDITKTDFFDFVVTPDSNDSHSIQQFTKQMRSVNAFLGNTSPSEGKEPNNNIQLSSSELSTIVIPTNACSTDNSVTFDSTFWNDKESVRLDSAILEDLNKYWNTEEIQKANNHNNNNNNSITTTDGQIYTLTVLNGLDQNATWYRQPLTQIKEEDISMSSPGSMEHLQAGLDIDSILSIIPGQMNGFTHSYNEATMSPNTDGLIKSETYTYEDSGFADNKDELANSLIIDTPLLEAHDNFNNNNNDWKLTNNNNNNNSNGPDSLLRSALQGKAFVRYNGTTLKNSGATNKLENNTELRRVLSTPPNKTETTIFIKEEPDHIPTIVAGIDANGKVIFEEHIPPRSIEADNSTSTHNVDDLILSKLDQSFPEDFEEIKRIANEVNQYCQIETTGDNTVYSISADQIGILNSLNTPIQISAAPIVTTSSNNNSIISTKPPAKKYKRSNNNSGGNNSKTQNPNNTVVQQNATSSTSNGVRKERSLHYCSICSKGFKDKYSVNVHIRTHTGEKPFACSLCGKSFRQKAHLAKHYQTHVAQKNAAAAGNSTTVVSSNNNNNKTTTKTTR